MKVLQQCQECGLELAKNTCKLCGRVVCDYDYDVDRQTCKRCKQILAK